MAKFTPIDVSKAILKYKKYYELGDSLLFYMMLDDTSKYPEFYQYVENELRHADKFLNEFDITEDVKLGKMTLFHTIKGNVFKTKHKFMSCTDITSLSNYISGLTSGYDSVNTLQIDKKLVISAYDIHKWILTKLERMMFYECDITMRIEWEREKLITFNEPPFKSIVVL